ncbi:hypothetical protein A3Q56_05168, partial [Intoshia linei]
PQDTTPAPWSPDPWPQDKTPAPWNPDPWPQDTKPAPWNPDPWPQDTKPAPWNPDPWPQDTTPTTWNPDPDPCNPDIENCDGEPSIWEDGNLDNDPCDPNVENCNADPPFWDGRKLGPHYRGNRFTTTKRMKPSLPKNVIPPYPFMDIPKDKNSKPTLTDLLMYWYKHGKKNVARLIYDKNSKTKNIKKVTENIISMNNYMINYLSKMPHNQNQRMQFNHGSKNIGHFNITYNKYKNEEFSFNDNEFIEKQSAIKCETPTLKEYFKGDKFCEVLKSNNEWMFVERLYPKTIVSLPPKHEKYPTPSGWFPINTKLASQESYFVDRTRFHNLPIYIETMKLSTVQISVIRFVSGNMKKLIKDLRIYLMNAQKKKLEPEEIIIDFDEVCRKIRVYGVHLREISNFLIDKGF